MSKIIPAKIAMAIKSQRGYHTFSCVACDKRNKRHEKTALKKDPTGNLVWICNGCHREVHVSPACDGVIVV